MTAARTPEGGGSVAAALAALASRPVEPVPRLALNPDEAAAAVGISRDHLERHVMPELRVVRSGRRVIVPVRELQRWLDANAAMLLDWDHG